MGIFGPGWKSDNTDKVIRWISKQSGTSRELMDAIRYRHNSSIRKAAIDQITEDAMLSEVIRSGWIDSDWAVMDYAAAAIKDQAVLVDLAKDRYTCAVKALQDEKALRDIVMDPEFFRPEPPEKNAGQGSAEHLASLAFGKLKAPDLMEVIKGSPYSDVAAEAAKRITDTDLLKAIAKDSSFPNNVRTVGMKACSPKELDWIADDHDGMRDYAIWLLKKNVSQVTDPVVRRKYCRKYETHDWEWLENDSKEYGDTRTVISRYRCKYCGATKTETESYKF
ncbi:MAG: hypothetical protein IJH91_00480 [Mogibacterium sp.]|nr:hypothetical protein [Mogibacterium sp.]